MVRMERAALLWSLLMITIYNKLSSLSLSFSLSLSLQPIFIILLCVFSFQVFRDVFTNRELNSLSIRCPSTLKVSLGQACLWVGEIRLLRVIIEAAEDVLCRKDFSNFFSRIIDLNILFFTNFWCLKTSFFFYQQVLPVCRGKKMAFIYDSKTPTRCRCHSKDMQLHTCLVEQM